MYYLLGKCLKAFSALVAFAPAPVRTLLGDGIGLLWFDVLRIRRRTAIENLRIAYPNWDDERRTQVARLSLRHMGRTITEFCLFPFYRASWFDRYFEIEGRPYLDEALAKGKGVMFLGLHLGNGDFAIAALSRLGYKMNLISKVFKNKPLNDLWFGMRGQHGTRFIAPEKSTFEILRALKRKEIVIFVLDQFMGPPVGVRTRFFGKETGTAAGLALMAERARCPVIPSYTYRREDGKTVIVFLPEIPFVEQDDREKTVAAMTQAYADQIEDMVRRHPEQWMWIHRRWKEFRE